MEIKYAHEMASIAEATRVAKCAKDTVSARTYLEENLMKDIEAVAERAGIICLTSLILKMKMSKKP